MSEDSHVREKASSEVERLLSHLEPQWVNKELLEGADHLLLFRLPKDNHLETMEALRDLPYPTLTIRRSLPTALDQRWPGDFAISVGDTLYCMDYRLKEVLRPLFDFADKSINTRIRVNVGGFVNSGFDGGQVVIDEKGRNAVTSHEPIQRFLVPSGYRSVFINEWGHLPYRNIYRDKREYLFLSHSNHIDPLVTLFTDKAGKTHLWIDEVINRYLTGVNFPRLWDRELVDHHAVRMGVLNLQYVGRYVLTPPRKVLGYLDKELRVNGYIPVYMPYEVTSEDGGAKCRSLLIPLGSPDNENLTIIRRPLPG